MSEYQYYEWQTIDRLLTDAEQAKVGQLSSHIAVTASQAAVTYNWSDFRHDPRQVLARYFDAFLYLSNWGTRELAFRFPKALIDRAAIAPYLVAHAIELTFSGQHAILALLFNDEEGGGEWVEGEGLLGGLVGLKNDILEGDYRSLYLAWLQVMVLDDPDEVAGYPEPPVPAGLKKLTPALQRFADFIELDAHLIAAAAEASPAQPRAQSDEALHVALAGLSREECEAYLTRLLAGEPGLAQALRQQLRSTLPSAESRLVPGSRTFRELVAAAKRLKREAAQRKAEAARKRRAAKLAAMAGRELEIWKQAEAPLESKQSSRYAEAVAHLVDLRDLADMQGTHAEFDRRLQQLRERYKTRTAFLAWLRDAGLA